MVPSRETSSMTTPLLTISGAHQIPTDIVMTTISNTSTGSTETVVFDSNSYTTKAVKYRPAYDSATGEFY